MHVSTIERLVRRLRETGRVADRPRSGRPRVTSQRQDRAIRLAHLRYRHLTATETAVNTVGSHNRRIHPKTVRKQQHQMTFHHDNALPHVARVCQDFLATTTTLYHSTGYRTVQICPQFSICGTNWTGA